MATEQAFGRLEYLWKYQGVRQVVRKGKSSREKLWSNMQGPGGEIGHRRKIRVRLRAGEAAERKLMRKGNTC